jgi:hypothetical protein
MLRKIVFTLVLGLALHAGAQSDMRPWDNGRLQVSANQRFLQFANGTPFFVLGDTGWLLPERLDRAEAQYYLQSCRRAGYNLVQVQTMNGVPSINIYGQLSLPYGWDMSKVDPEGVYSYWDHMDYIIKVAEQNGIYIGMVPIWGSLVKAGKMNVEQARAYGKFLGQRYADSPNIIWFIGGDLQGDVHPEVWEALARSIKQYDKNHLMTYHPRGRYTSARWWSKAEWLDFHTFQSGHRRYNQRMGNADYPIPDDTEEDNWMYVDSTWNYKPIKPVFDSEPSYEDIPKGLHDPNEDYWRDNDVRRYAYWSVFAGSCGHTYGHNSIMQMLKPGNSTSYGRDGEEKLWYEALKSPGFSQMKHLKNLMLTFPYFERVPDQSVISGKNGTKYDRLIATRGNDYLLVYNYNKNTMNVDLRKISGSSKKIWWMDAATGKLKYLGEKKNETVVLNPHETGIAAHDGVLIAVDATKDYLDERQEMIVDRSMAGRKRDLNE